MGKFADCGIFLLCEGGYEFFVLCLFKLFRVSRHTDYYRAFIGNILQGVQYRFDTAIIELFKVEVAYQNSLAVCKEGHTVDTVRERVNRECTCELYEIYIVPVLADGCVKQAVGISLYKKAFFAVKIVYTADFTTFDGC